MEAKETHNQEKYLSYLGLGVIALIFGSYFYFSFLIANDVPLSDHWDWIRELLMPYLNGEISFSQYIAGEFIPFAHSHILTLLALLLNYSIFDLRFDFECYIGMVCIAVSFFFLMWKYYETAATTLNRRYLVISGCVLAAILLNPFNVNISPLIQFEYLYLLLAVVYLSAYDSVLKNNIRPGIFYIFTFAYFFVGDAMGAVSILTVLLHVLFVSPLKTKFNQIAGIIVALACGYLVWRVYFLYVEPTIVGPNVATKSEAFVFIFSHKLDSIKFILNGYSQGLIEQHSVVKRLFGYGFPGITLLIGLLMLVFNMSAFYLYLTRRKIIASSLPGLLIIFSAVIVFGILLSRFPLEGPLYSLNDRYQRLSVIGVFGSYWIYALVFFSSTESRSETSENSKHSGRLLVTALTVAILLNSLVSHAVSWKYDYLNKLNRLNTIAGGIVDSAVNPAIDLGKYVTYRHCSNDICKSTVQFLKENELSVFRPSHMIHRGQKIIDEYDANPPGK